MNLHRQLLQYLRMLQRRKVTTFIAIGGFALSLSVVVLLSVFITSEKAMNSSYPNNSSIYRIKTKSNRANLPSKLAEQLANDIPEVKANTVFRNNVDHVRVNDELLRMSLSVVDKDYLKIFSHRMVYSGPLSDLDVKNNIILTHSFSKKLFGDVNPVGNYMEMRERQLRVIGVITDPPVNSSFKFDGLIGEVSCMQYSEFTTHMTTYRLVNHFIQLEKGCKIDDVETKITALMQARKGFEKSELEVQPLSKIYFDTQTRSALPVANSSMLKLLVWISLVILLMGVFNYVSLAVSINTERMGEIAMRKVNGAGARIIFKQFLQESVMVCLLIIGLATIIAVFITPIFSSILGKEIDLLLLFKNSASWKFMGILFMVVVLLAGIIPALLASHVLPVVALKGKKNKKNNHFRQTVLVFQLTTSIVLIFGVATIWNQIEYAKTKDIGFEKELLLGIDLDYFEKDQRALRSRLLQIANVKNASCSAGAPYNICANMSGEVDEIKISDVSGIEADTDFISTFQIKLLAGRNLRQSDKGCCMINEKLYEKMGWKDLDGKKMFGRDVVGVIDNFHFKNIHHDIGFLMVDLLEDYEWVSTINLRFASADYKNTISQMKNVMAEFDPDLTFNYKFYDEIVAALYRKEEKQAYAVGLFAIIAILIACLGLIGVAEYTITQRVKEIGIRKVNGATVSGILSMINAGFGKWILLAFVLAAPIAFYLMNKWLQSFAYKASLSWSIYLFTGIVVLVIALVTILFQSYKAATCNPVETLRYE